MAAGVGLRFIGLSIDKTVVQPVLAMGILAIAIGAGFLLSAFVSFVLSKRLGLLGPGATADAPALSE